MEDWIVVSLRTISMFSLLIIVIPLLGKKPMSSMTTFDVVAILVTAIMIALIVLNVMINLETGLLALGIWFSLLLAIQYLVQKSKWIHDHLYGKEIVVIKEGKVLEENLQSAKLTGEELLSQLRRKSIFQVADVEFAVMETNGDITALLKRESQPLTPKDVRIKVSVTQEPQTVILDGNIMDEALTTRGLNRAWLFSELDKMSISVENIFIGQLDSMGELYIDLFDDTLLQPQNTAKELLLATLQSIEANFMTFALETEDTYWKEQYQQYASQVKKDFGEFKTLFNNIGVVLNVR